ncbi:unnamed protein product [Paramecium octaurelia]|uniref:Uncharacterized protein n=1 Tax=Paramecium octaurelia TaxID=43137 RepID=A0A8S1WPK8_PAROT|nr:unnamed protein product [Paramecium octaurelia]
MHLFTQFGPLLVRPNFIITLKFPQNNTFDSIFQSQDISNRKGNMNNIDLQQK